jgi:hypothetical protein
MEVDMSRIFSTLVFLTIALFVSGCAEKETKQPAALVGAWRSSLQFETGAFAPMKDLEFMYVFNDGGTMTESSNYDGAPPVPPAYGVWREVGPGEFEAKYEYYATAPSDADAFQKGAGWLPSGRGVFIERITLSADGQSFTSTIRYEALGLDGNPAEGGGEAKGKAVRIQF